MPQNQAESELEGHFSVPSVKTQYSEYVEARNEILRVIVKVGRRTEARLQSKQKPYRASGDSCSDQRGEPFEHQ